MLSAESFCDTLSFYGCPESSDYAGNFLCLLQCFIKLMFVNVTDVECDIKLGAQLGARCFGDHQKLVEFCRAAPLKALRNIRHDRNGCTLNLILQTKILGKSTLRGETIY